MKITLVCQSCHKKYPSSEPIWRCECGGMVSLDFLARFPRDKIQKRKSTLWRYREALPIEHDEHIVSFDEGFTPLVEEELYGKKVLLKQDHLFPSGSFKDRGATVLISKVKELGVRRVVEDSSGNAGAAIAAYCAKAGVTCDIYVPKKTTLGKLNQIKQSGAILHKISGSREDTQKAVWQVAQNTYYASHYWNPFFVHGTKTFIFEVVEQLNWTAPDTLIIPVGNGTLLLGAFLGLKELRREKIIETLPKIIGVQAEHCAPLANAWKKHCGTIEKMPVKETIAEGIAITNPVRAADILQAVKETKGNIISIREQDIAKALHDSMRKGFYIEPTSAVAIAAVRKIPIGKNEVVVVPLTGHGLKKS